MRKMYGDISTNEWEEEKLKIRKKQEEERSDGKEGKKVKKYSMKSS